MIMLEIIVSAQPAQHAERYNDHDDHDDTVQKRLRCLLFKVTVAVVEVVVVVGVRVQAERIQKVITNGYNSV